jgi:ATP-binding cassette subfamily F protein uup
VDHLLVFEGDGEVKDFPGNYSEYRAYLEYEQEKNEQQPASPKTVNAITPTISSTPKKKVSFKDMKEFETLEKEIADLNKEKDSITVTLGAADLAFEEIQKLSARIGEITVLVDSKELRWLELSELMG